MKRVFTLLIVSMLLTINVFAQEQNYGGMITQNEDGTYFYMRSSLEMVYLTSETMFDKARVDPEDVVMAWENYMDPNKNFPPQYNKHGANIPSLSLGQVDEINEKGDTITVSDDVLRARIEKYIEDNKVANQLIMRWFNYNPNGTINYDIENPENPDAKLNMATIFERGYYNVNAGDENVAMSALKRDKDTQIKELSMKLIPFTFLTFTELNYVDNEPAARRARDIALVAAAVTRDLAIKNGVKELAADLAYKAAVKGINAVYESAKEGRTLRSKTWLFRLVWDEETEAYFNNEVVANPKLLETSDKFKVEYVDHQNNNSTVIFGGKKGHTRVVELTTVRNLNKVFSEMQKRNDVFKVWTPLLDFYSLVNPNIYAPITVNGKIVTAEIGTGEGLRGGEMFSIVDDDGNFYGYAKAVKGKIRDNAVVTGGDAEFNYVPQTDRYGNPVTATTFKVKKPQNLRSGLYLCDPKAPKRMRVAARIGTKEGVEPGDKFHVYLYDAVSKKLKRVGMVRAVKGKVWDNIYYNSDNDMTLKTREERNASAALKVRDKEGLRTTETLFKGSCKIQPGMFIRRAR